MTNIHLQETEVDKDTLYKRVLEELNRALKGTKHVVEGAPMTSVMLDNGEYRTKPVHGDQELLFKEVRLGKLGKVLFSFTPTDEMPWKWCEWDSAKLDAAVPLFGSTLSEKLGLSDLPEMLTTIVSAFIDITAETMAKEAEDQKKAAVELYADNDKFGAF